MDAAIFCRYLSPIWVPLFGCPYLGIPYLGTPYLNVPLLSLQNQTMPSPSLPLLIEALHSLAPSIIAYSGGVDSALLLAAAIKAAPLGKEPAAIFTRSATQTNESIQNARRVARELRVPRYIELPSHEMKIPDFFANTKQRCYYCKKERFGLLREWGTNHPPKQGVWTFLEGNNADDRNDYRPGTAAAKELNFLSPLADLGWTKADIRAAAAKLGLSCADRPSEPCLITRLTYHLVPTEELLRKIEEGEKILRQAGFPICRLRVLSDTQARIEVGQERLFALNTSPARETILGKISALGFTTVTIDPNGYHKS